MGRSDESLRTRLRADTRVAHEKLDETVSQFDLTTRGGFERFLGMQSSALRSIAPHAGPAKSRLALLDLLDRVEADLSHFDWVAAPAKRLDEAPHPHAIDYVIAGSRLGTQVLKQRWLAARDPHVRRADAYFSAPSYVEIWKSFCMSTGALPPYGSVADQVIRDADRLFQLYQECTGTHQNDPGEIHA